MQRPGNKFTRLLCALGGLFGAAFTFPAHAQSEIVFAPGTGEAQLITQPPAAPIIPRFACADLPGAISRLNAQYPALSVPTVSGAASGGTIAPPSPRHRLDKALLDDALASYDKHVCPLGSGAGPQVIIVVDYAKHSSEPRLYGIDLASGDGIDRPILVAHGIGSDYDDDGYPDIFSNIDESLMSSLGAARGGEIYIGRNGLSLRLDGLDASNSLMRPRAIVAHSYAPERRRYFNYSLVAARGGKPGASEGCFVVEPQWRDWLFDRLRDGGFLYAGLGKSFADRRARAVTPPAVPAAEVVFAPGTGG
jgi:hypothetical protein